MHAYYAGLNDVLGIASMYAEAIARGHVFNDGNKRTGLSCCLAYLDRQGLHLAKDPFLEELTVALAKGDIDGETFAFALFDMLFGNDLPEPDSE